MTYTDFEEVEGSFSTTRATPEDLDDRVTVSFGSTGGGARPHVAVVTLSVWIAQAHFRLSSQDQGLILDLRQLVKTKDWGALAAVCRQLIMRRLTAERLTQIITETFQDGHNHGRRALQRELSDTLGITEGARRP